MEALRTFTKIYFFKYRSFIFIFSNKYKQKIYTFSSRAIYQLLEPLLGDRSLPWHLI
jgi:ACT domain-containing protein